MRKPVLAGVLFVLAVLAVIVYSTLELMRSHYRVEVCMEYAGRTACRTASGSTRDFALRSAMSNACAQIASGVTETIGCEQSKPVKQTWR